MGKAEYAAPIPEIEREVEEIIKQGPFEGPAAGHPGREYEREESKAERARKLAAEVAERLLAAYPNSAEFTAVRHGRWRLIDDDYNCWRCTCCGEEWVLNDGNPSDNGMAFCPHCGARMDGEEESRNENKRRVDRAGGRDH